MPWKLLLFAAGLLAAPRALALQPLETFLRGAREAGTDNAEARALRRQARAQADGELGRALPGLSLRGTWTRNESETRIQLPGTDGGPPTTVTLTPKDQLDGTATLDVPLVDLSRFARIAAARTSTAAAARQEAATDLRVQSAVAQDYHQLLANLALVEASRRSLDVARESLRLAEVRHEAGAAAPLDVDRARAEVERNVQQLAAAELQVALVARSLASASGIAPELEGEVALAGDLREEAPLERFQPPEERLPALAAASLVRAAAEQEARARRLSLVPSLGASLSEVATNAEGLGGRDHFWQGVVALTWSFDLTKLADIRAQDAAAEGARAREQRVRLAARDDVHRAWQTVRTNLARSRSARVEAEVSARAAQRARDRYQVGDAPQLDLLQAQRDAFAADAARIQSFADLANSRAQLRLAAGESLLEGAKP
jgi:outer membrane protein TolC